MKIDLNCPYAEHRTAMRVYCTKTDDLCGNQYFKRCKGWWTLNEAAEKCPLRKEQPK